MAIFKKRLSAPTPTDKWWIHYTAGGTNMCIKVNGNSCLPNCVGYAWGRVSEILGKQPPLSRANAEDWWAYNDGLQRGQEPKLGAVICWRRGQVHNGNDGAGHVAVVEEIKSNGDIVISQSGYKSPNGKTTFDANFSVRTLTKASGYFFGSAYTFQGFIYCGLEFDQNSDGQQSQPVKPSNSNFKAGDQVTLLATPCYISANKTSSFGVKTGTYYLWDGEVINNRIKITTTKSYVGVQGKVTCWCNIDDLGLSGNSKKLIPALAIPVIKRGSKGAQAKLLQEDLNYCGADLATDGSFGPLSQTALVAWQKKNGLVADGIYGPKSQAKMKTLLK